MGNGGLISAVADAGPLIHLAEIGCLSALGTFGALHIPNAVWSETFGQGRVASDHPALADIVHQHMLGHVDVEPFVQENSLGDLHGGESACLCLCRQLELSTLLTDDLAAREAAKLLKLAPVGLLGIITRANRLGHMSLKDAEQGIADLFDVSSLYVTRAIIEAAIAQLHKYADKGQTGQE